MIDRLITSTSKDHASVQSGHPLGCERSTFLFVAELVLGLTIFFLFSLCVSHMSTVFGSATILRWDLKEP